MSYFVHIGHNKTGSFAIQSFLAVNKDLLASYGIDYPDHPSFSSAKKGHVSRGNGERCFDIPPSQENSLLFSDASLFLKLHDGDRIRKFIDTFHEKPTLICFTRDLFDHYVSFWGQNVKRGGSIKTINEFAPEYKSIYWIFFAISQIIRRP